MQKKISKHFCAIAKNCRLLKKSKSIFFVIIFFALNFLAAQTFNTVDVEDEIYDILSVAEMSGMCSILHNARPYNESYINKLLDEIIQNAGENSAMGKVALAQKKRFFREEKLFDVQTLSWRFANSSEKFPITFIISDGIQSLASGGIYNNSGANAFAYELWNIARFRGDLGNHMSYSAQAFLGFVKTPLQKMPGTYDIGGWWYCDNSETATKGRLINSYRNNAFLPYDYKKFWDGNLFYLSKMDNSGLEGWPFSNSFGFGMLAEITFSFLEGHIELGIGRYSREYAAMDKNSSLALNSRARPFFGFDFNFNVLKWLSLYATFGFLEFPNQAYMIKDDGATAWPKHDDSYYFQNMFAIGVLNLDWKYFHFDFGSSVVYPKRTELGYIFPLIDKIVYQDDLGDFDNLALFGNIKVRIPKYVEMWFSLYLDEKENLKLNKEFFEKTRNMFAFQLGIKGKLPDKIFPLGTISFRYTKIEPYCYTHHAINYTPWYAHYVSESYTNNGSCLGYYMPPNSDEFLLRIETHPTDACRANFQTQFARHGADYGSGAVLGSSLYSELPAGNSAIGRGQLKKYFLKDGAYEWSVAVSLGAAYNLKKHGVPLELLFDVGIVHIWWTDSGTAGQNKKGSYKKIDTKEYPAKTGVVMSLGIKVFGN